MYLIALTAITISVFLPSKMAIYLVNLFLFNYKLDGKFLITGSGVPKINLSQAQ